MKNSVAVGVATILLGCVPVQSSNPASTTSPTSAPPSSDPIAAAQPTAQPRLPDEVAAILAKPTLPFRSIISGNLSNQAAQVSSHVINTDAEEKHLGSKDPFIASLLQNASQSVQRSPEEQGIFLIAEEQPAFGYDLEVLSIEELEEEVLIHSIVWEPSRGDFVQPMMQRPFQYVAMKRTTKPIRILEPLRAERSAKPPDDR